MERNYELNRKPLLNIAQLADLLGVTQRTVRDWVFKGKIDSTIVRVGRLIRFDADKISRRIESGKVLD